MSARFFKQDLVSSKISNAYISFYVLKTNQDDPLIFIYNSINHDLRIKVVSRRIICCPLGVGHQGIGYKGY